MKRFAENLRAVVIALLAIILINTAAITMLDKFVFNKKKVEAEPTVTVIEEETEDETDDETDALIEALIAQYGAEEEKTLDSFDKHADGNEKPVNALTTSASTVTGLESKSSKAKETEAKAQSIYNKYYAILSGMQGYYQGRANAIISTAQAEYWDGRNKGVKHKEMKSIVYSKYVSILSALLGECEGAVEGVLGQMTAELNTIGADTSSVNELRGIYKSILSSFIGQFKL